MPRRAQIIAALAALGFLCVCCDSASHPIAVEVLGTAHEQIKPMVIRIKNLSAKPVQLALPEYVDETAARFAQDPIEVQHRKDNHWEDSPLISSGPKPRKFPVVDAGQTAEFQFGVEGTGEFRLLVWYLVSAGDLGPPIHPPKYARIVSGTFRVD